MKTHALLMTNPPFAADRLDALMAADSGDSLPDLALPPTPLAEAIGEFFTHPVHSAVVLEPAP